MLQNEREDFNVHSIIIGGHEYSVSSRINKQVGLDVSVTTRTSRMGVRELSGEMMSVLL